MTTQTVWFPPLRQTEESDQAIIVWCEEQGIDAHGIARIGFRIEQSADGTLTAKYLEYRRREDGGWAKKPGERTVTSIPPVHPITGEC